MSTGGRGGRLGVAALLLGVWVWSSVAAGVAAARTAESAERPNATWTAPRYLAAAAKMARRGEIAPAAGLYRACLERFGADPRAALAAARHGLPLERLLGHQREIDTAMVILRERAAAWPLDPAGQGALGRLERTYGTAAQAEARFAAALDGALARTGPAAAKTAVAAAGELIGLARERRDQQRIDEVLRRLRALPIADLGFTARERVARLHLDNGRASDGEDMLTDLVNAYAATPDRRRDAAPALRAFARLAEIARARDDAAAVETLVALIEQAFAKRQTLEPRERERLARIEETLGRGAEAAGLWQGVAIGYRDAPEAEDRKAALRSVAALARGRQPGTAALAADVERADDASLDDRDRYRLALLAAARDETEGAARLRDLVTDIRNPTAAQVPVLLDALAKLLAEEHAAAAAGGRASGGSGGIGGKTPAPLAAWAARTYPTATFDPAQRYQMGLLLLEHGATARGEQVLAAVAEADRSDAGAKALWVLAKEAERRGDSRVAMQRYRTYVERYADNPRFVAKAYAHLVDLQARSGANGAALKTLSRLREVAAGSGDWLTQLAAARDLAGHQAQDLEAATFALGLRGAEAALAAARAAGPSGDRERLQVHCEVSRYAWDTARAPLAEEHAAAAQALVASIDAAPLGGADRELVARLSALAHRLRMRAALATGNPAAAADSARAFLAGDPDDPDRDFALWHLAQALAAQGKAEEATRVYGQVSGAFAERARAAIGRLAR